MVFSADNFDELCKMVLTYLSNNNKGEWRITGHSKFSNYLEYRPPQSNTFQIQVKILYQSEYGSIIVIVGRLGTFSPVNYSFEQVSKTNTFKIQSYGNEPLKGLIVNIFNFVDPYIKKISKEISAELYKKAA